MYLTIPNFENLSAQETFDMAVNHIATTRKPGYEHGSCSYTSGCAASPFIHEDRRRQADEHGSWANLITAVEPAAPSANAHLIIAIQRAHDGAALESVHSNIIPSIEPFMVKWKHRMIDIAKEFRLDDSTLQAVNVE